MEKESHDKLASDISERLIKQLDVISDEAKMLSRAQDTEVVKQKLRKFSSSLSEFEKTVFSIKDKKAAELKEVAKTELGHFNGIVATLLAQPVVENESISSVIYPTIISLAAAVKMFMSDKDAPPPPPPLAQAASRENIVTSNDTLTGAVSIISKSEDSDNSEAAVVASPPKIVDLTEFCTTCEKSLELLRGPNVDCAQLMSMMAVLLLYVKQSLTTETLNEGFDAEITESFVLAVKKLRHDTEGAQISSENASLIQDKISKLLWAVRNPAPKLALSSAPRLPSATSESSKSEDILNASVEFKKGSTQSLEEHQPLGYQHELFQPPSPGLRMKSDSISSMKSSTSLNESVLMKDSFFNLSIQPNNKARPSFRNNGPKSPLSVSQDDLINADSDVSATDSPIFGSSKLTEEATGPTRPLLQIKAINVTSIDILPQGSQGKYGIVLEILIKKGGLKADDDPKTIRKSDTEIKTLARNLDSEYPGLLPQIIDSDSSKPNVKEINLLLKNFEQFFELVNKNTSLLKTSAVSAFIQDSLRMSEETNAFVISMDKMKIDRPINEVDAFFFTTKASSTNNRFSIIQIDPREGLRLTLHLQKDASGARIGSDQPLSPKVASLKDFALKSSSLDQLFKPSDIGSSIKSKRSTASSNESDSNLAAGADLRRRSTIRSSKFFSFVSRSSKAYDDKKTDSSSSYSSASLAVADRATLVRQKKFEAFFDTYKDAGFVKTAEDTMVIKDDKGQDILIIRNSSGTPRVSGCTVEKLIETVIFDQPTTDPENPDCFLLTYRHNIKPQVLLVKVIEGYKKVSISNDLPAEIGQMKIAAFVSLWVTSYWEDFERDPVLNRSILKFVSIIQSSKKVSLMGHQVADNIEKQKRLYKEYNDYFDASKSFTLSRGIIQNQGAVGFASIDPIIIAEQITRMDSELLAKIRPIHFVDYLWGKDNKSVKSVNEWITRFNTLSFWVATEICTTPLLKQRVAILENMIKLLRALRDLSNYNAVMAIIAGLNVSSVRRLKKTWESVSSKSMTILHEAEKAMDPQFNYQKYRDQEQKGVHQSIIPFLGLYFKDLTFANDGNQKTLPNGLINFAKNWAIYEIVKKVKQFQQNPYSIPMDKAVSQYLVKMVALPEDRLYKYSLLCEPKQKSDATITPETRLIEKWSK